MLRRGDGYDEIYRGFRWDVPARFNIAAACDHHADSTDRLALVYEAPDGTVERFSFDDLKRLSNRCANVLAGLGIAAGDRVGVLLPQRPETAIAHLAIYKLGAIAVPLFVQFGPDAIEHRLADSGAKALITDGENLAKVPSGLPGLATILVVERDSGEGDSGGHAPFWPSLDRARDSFAPADTAADDPALIIYTSGTTGKPKGALHAHRVLLGHLPGVQLPHDFFPQPGDLYWTPADWAWIGGLLDVLLPSFYFGVPVLAHRARKFDPEEAFALMARHQVRNAFLPPTALKMMRGAPAPRGLALRSVASGGEALGDDILAWSRDALGVQVNEFYGQTEANLLVGNCASLFPVRPGSMGRAIPGHRVAVVSPQGETLAPGETGIIAVARPDPVMFLGYWNNPEATRAKFAGGSGAWCLTGDVAIADDEGYIFYKGREDDLISSGGYRIGPTDIEDCLMKHRAVLMAAAVGIPDPVRGERIRAFVVARPGVPTGAAIADDIRAFVGGRLAWYQAPRDIVFVDELPLTATGKIIRRDLRERGRERG